MGLLFAVKKVPSLEEFRQKFNEVLLEPCKRVHSELGGWWKEALGQTSTHSSTRLARPIRTWLITECACNRILQTESVDEEFVDELDWAVEDQKVNEISLFTFK